MPDRLTGLEVFAKVAAAGSLSAAGRVMGLSQTMVTKHLAALEARLGAKLFHRTTRRLSLTDAGRSYLESCERILAEIEAAEAAVAADRLEPRGLLRLNVPLGIRGAADRAAPCGIFPQPSACHRRAWAERPAGRPCRGRLGPCHPHRQSP